MKVLSTRKLSKTVSEKRKAMGLTQEQLGEQASLHRVMVGRIEREDFIPSIVQLQALADVLQFEITEMFVVQEEQHPLIALRSEQMSEEAQQGFDTLISMILTLRKHMVLRKTYEEEYH